MELDEEISTQLTKSLTDTCIHTIKPSKDKLVEALKLQAHQISSLPEEKIKEYLYIFAQYTVFLNVQANSRKILYLEAKRAFEMAISNKVTHVEGKTVKERLAKVLETDESIQKLEKDLRIKEADSTLFENIPESIIEISNALKKIMYNPR